MFVVVVVVFNVVVVVVFNVVVVVVFNVVVVVVVFNVVVVVVFIISFSYAPENGFQVRLPQLAVEGAQVRQRRSRF